MIGIAQFFRFLGKYQPNIDERPRLDKPF